MNLDLASFAFGANLVNGTGTSPWGTSLGQSQPNYKFTSKGYENILCGMVYNSVPLRKVGLPLGRGGNTIYCHEDAGCQLAAVFNKVFINEKRIEAPFAMVIYKEDSFSHAGRRHLKYSPRIFFQDKTGYIHTNQDFLKKAYESLELADDACWFVYKMDIHNLDELHMSAIIVRADGYVTYEDSKSRKQNWISLVNEKEQYIDNNETADEYNEDIAENQTTQDTNKFISVSEAASIAGVTNETIRHLCKNKTIRYQKRGTIFMPYQADVILYSQQISDVQTIKCDIEQYKSKLEKEREQLQLASAEAERCLREIRLSPRRIERIVQLVHSLLMQYEKNPTEDISTKDLELMLMVFHGDAFTDIGLKRHLCRERIRQLWDKTLRKLAVARNEIKLREDKITSLNQTIKKQQESITNIKIEKSLIIGLREILSLLSKPVSSLDFSVRTNGAFQYVNINTVLDLVKSPRRRIMSAPNVGKKSLEEVDTWLKSHGLSYDMKFPNDLDAKEIELLLLSLPA